MQNSKKGTWFKWVLCKISKLDERKYSVQSLIFILIEMYRLNQAGQFSSDSFNMIKPYAVGG